jgi:four helix bundle protein
MGDAISLQEGLRNRTKAFAREIIRLLGDLPRTQVARVLGDQLLRSATSVAANYRAAGRSRSRRDFISRIGIVLEEADESLYWLELMVDAEVGVSNRLQPLIKEASELVLIFAASQATVTNRRRPGSIRRFSSSPQIPR